MAATIELNGHEARLLGVLIEKQMTTPEGYPLSIHAASAGCNQKSNRDPVVEWSEAEVIVGLQGLVMKHLAGRTVPMGSRVEKFHHNARPALDLDDAGLAVLAELLMRGPQTPGELRTRASRMAPIDSLEKLSAVLYRLIEKGYVRRIDPAPGSRAERYVQLLSPGLHPLDAPAAAAPARAESAPRAPGLEARVAELERQVAELRQRLDR